MYLRLGSIPETQRYTWDLEDYKYLYIYLKHKAQHLLKIEGYTWYPELYLGSGVLKVPSNIAKK